jgi:hypothetical protein
MRKLIALALMALSTSTCLADDTHIHMGAGGIAYFSGVEDGQISLHEETITFTLSNIDRYDVKADFVFMNSGSEVSYDIGFPVYAYQIYYSRTRESWDGQIPIDGFHTTVDGAPTEFEKRLDSAEKDVLAWYTKKVTFRGSGRTDISVEYSSKYGTEGGAFGVSLASYYYGSANTWKGPIEKIKLIVCNKSDYFVWRIENLPQDIARPSIEIVDDITTSVEYSNIKPSRQAVFDINLTRFPSLGMSENPWSQVRKDDIRFATLYQLSILRNTTYASHGYIFNSQELTSFFSRLPWYKPLYRNVDNMLNEAEKQSIAIIRAMEKARMESKRNTDATE